MLPIFGESYRPSSHWAQDLALKQDALQKLEPFAPALEAKILEHLFAEQVAQSLALGDIKVAPERVRAIISGSTQENSQMAERAALGLANAVRYLHTLVAKHESKAQFLLTSDLLRELHALTVEGFVDGGGFYRTAEGKPLAEGHQPTSPEALPVLIDNALDWFSAESFDELHPVEQAWLVHLRLMDLQPFADANGRVVRLAASLYTLRADLGPIIVSAQDRSLYNHALVNSFQMVTQPGVELFARSLMRTLDEVIAIAKTDDNSSSE